MPTIKLEYTGDLQCQVCHEQSGIELFTDAPVDNQGQGRSFSPTDLIAVSLGSCVATIMGIAANKKGLSIEGMTMEVVKKMSQTGPRRIASLDVDIRMPPGVPLTERDYLEQAVHTCPVEESLHPDMQVSLNFNWS